MNREYRDQQGRPMTREEVYQLPAEELELRSGIPVRIIPDYEKLYAAVADAMIEVLLQRQGRKTTMILPVGPIGQYPVFA